MTMSLRMMATRATFFLLSGGGQPIIDKLEVDVEARGNDGGKVERLA